MDITRRFFCCCVYLLTYKCVNAQTDTSLQPIDTSRLPADTLQKDSVVRNADSLIRYRINGAYLKSIFEDIGYTVTRPARWEGRDFRRLGIVLGTTGLLMAADYEIKNFVQGNRTNTVNNVARRIEPFGNTYSPYLIVGMYLGGVIAKDRRLEHASLMTAKSLVVSTLIYTASKVVIRRMRPSFGNDPFNYDPPFTGDRQHTSFPSGHTLTATAVATALAEIYGHDHPWVPWVAYTVAGLTGVSRIYENRHWSSDVWVAASLGFFVTKSVFRRHRELERKKAMMTVKW